MRVTFDSFMIILLYSHLTELFGVCCLSDWLVTFCELVLLSGVVKGLLSVACLTVDWIVFFVDGGGEAVPPTVGFEAPIDELPAVETALLRVVMD